MPSLDGVRDALAAFRAAVRAAAADPDLINPAAAASLHAEAVSLVIHAEHERERVLALARAAGATWERLETASGVADSTLRDRLTRWEIAAMPCPDGVTT